MAWLVLILAFALPAWSQSSAGSNQEREIARSAARKEKKKRGPGKEMGSGAGDIGKGAAKGAGDLGKGAAGGAGNLATGHPVRATASVGKGVGRGAGHIGVGAGKGVGKIGKGVGGEFKKLGGKKSHRKTEDGA